MNNIPIVIIGGGAAALSAALAASEKNVVLLTKGKIGDSNSSSSLAQGGIAAAMGKDDSPALHASDTLSVGAGLCEKEIVKLITGLGPKSIRQLLSIGAKFDKRDNGELELGKEAAHQKRRIVHAEGDSTGKEIMRVLTQEVKKSKSILEISDASAEEILLSENGECIGVMYEKDGKRSLLKSSGCILATGGIGNLYQHTTNPSVSNGDGIALAATTGAKLIDLEFVQFHPTALATDELRLPLITEAIRGEGAIIVDDKGERFLFNAHEDGELAPRDIVAKEIFLKKLSGSNVWIDVRNKAIGSSFKERFPSAYKTCVMHGINPLTDLIPIVPAAHYHMGGVLTDKWGRTTVPHLWACGEVASSGAHGANRLASNSLLEALVFGARAGADSVSTKGSFTNSMYLEPKSPSSDIFSIREEQRLRSIMWNKVGIIRDKKGLESAFSELLTFQLSKNSLSLKRRAFVASLITFAALNREESRGSHFREDFPNEVESFKKRYIVQCAPQKLMPTSIEITAQAA